MGRKQRPLCVYVELEEGVSLGKFLSQVRRQQGIALSDLQLEHDAGVPENAVAFLATVQEQKCAERAGLIASLREMEGVRFLETL